MAGHIKLTLVATSFLALTACSDAQLFSSWTQEAGGYMDNGTFGNATMNNIMIQNGELSYAVSMNERFAAEVDTTVNFEFNSAILDGPARETIKKQAHYIAQFPEVRFRVFGHTDLVGSEAANKALGMRRAQAVVSEMVRQGISRSRVEAVISEGETQPLVATQERERRNRRTVTEVSGFVQNNPLIMDSRYANIIHREYIESATAPSDLVEYGVSQIEE